MNRALKLDTRLPGPPAGREGGRMAVRSGLLRRAGFGGGGGGVSWVGREEPDGPKRLLGPGVRNGACSLQPSV